MEYTILNGHAYFKRPCSDVLKFMLGFYLVHDHVQKYDDVSEDAFYRVEWFISSRLIASLYDKIFPYSKCSLVN